MTTTEQCERCKGAEWKRRDQVLPICIACDRPRSTSPREISPRPLRHPHTGAWGCPDRIVDGVRQTCEPDAVATEAMSGCSRPA